ncbi:hypothetical protein EV190_101218 [Actinorugispora endophytica]|uniref:Uncharacterized protein n=1 Tax=Actinorugispora endophytica TaxID=1605990 RepID=A0A4R6V723_9ACTN|nr:hypothetical protein EV190_101218 [Actinorugispora endophytica]
MSVNNPPPDSQVLFDLAERVRVAVLRAVV